MPTCKQLAWLFGVNGPSTTINSHGIALSHAHSTSTRRPCRSSTLLCCAVLVACIYNIYVGLKSYMMRPAEIDLSQYTESIFLPFTSKFSSEDVTRIKCAIEGEMFFNMPVDTGSTGILIGAPILPHLDPTAGEPAHHFFTSSLILYTGRLVDLSVAFYGEHGFNATARVPVLIVDKSWQCPWYNPSEDGFNCPPGPHGETAKERDTSKIAYMGVGFGRNCPKDGMPIAAPQVNPFLNIDTIYGRPVAKASMRTGYIVTTEGVHLGLTEQNTQNFKFEHLQPGTTYKHDPRDWAMAQMCFSINGGGAHCGTALIDTGIAQMYIRAEEGVFLPTVTIRNPNKHGRAKTVKRVKHGTNIAVAFPSFDNQATCYSFSIGEGSAIEPQFVVAGRPSSPPFLNTGRNFLYGHSVAFDAIGGRLGLRPARASSSSL